MNSDLRNLVAHFNDVNYLHGSKQWAIRATDIRGEKVSLYYDPNNQGVVEVLNPPKWIGVRIDSFGIGYIEISDLPLFFEGKKIPTDSWRN